jgi:hypothetical protein
MSAVFAGNGMPVGFTFAKIPKTWPARDNTNEADLVHALFRAIHLGVLCTPRKLGLVA